MHSRPDLAFGNDEHTHLPKGPPEQAQSVVNVLSQHSLKSMPHSTPIM